MTELRDKIEHVVVLMLENRSFDHMLGAVASSAPVKQPSGTETNPDADGDPVPISFDAPIGIDVGPDHGHLGVMHQLTGLEPASKPPYFQKPYVVTNSGFVTSFEAAAVADDSNFAGYGKNIMRCHPEWNVPILARLAKEFAVCDQGSARFRGRHGRIATTRTQELRTARRTSRSDCSTMTRSSSASRRRRESGACTTTVSPTSGYSPASGSVSSSVAASAPSTASRKTWQKATCRNPRAKKTRPTTTPQ